MSPDDRPGSRMLGEAPDFLQVLDDISKVAPLSKPVLIVGERGTGKELVAERLHYLSDRWDQEFLKMNCAAISETLLESELFGHESGAFTGAGKLHRGRFERADRGTLFLDELATTSSLVQEKLLRLIEYGEFERLGGSRTMTVDVRLVAATNLDLPALANRGGFRRDLLDRLAFDVITLPPLRARPGDILLLAEHFAMGMARELDREFFPGFTERAKEQMLGYDWPGNIRELKNAVERAVYRGEPELPVAEVNLDPFASPWRPAGRNGEATEPPTTQEPSASRTLDDLEDQDSKALPGGQTIHTLATNRANTARLQQAPSAFPIDLKAAVQDWEVATLERALAEAKHNQKKAAELLGLTYHQLRGYLKKYDLVGS